MLTKFSFLKKRTVNSYFIRGMLLFLCFSLIAYFGWEALKTSTYKNGPEIIDCEVYTPSSYKKNSWPYTEISPQNQICVTIVIDVFRAATTASYVIRDKPNVYILAAKSAVLCRLTQNLSDIVLIGKSEKGASLNYNIPNSPTRVQGLNITGKNVFHRTEAGANGILLAKDADIILMAGFVNAGATVAYIKKLKNPHVKIIAMGHEGTTASLEDDLCANYIQTLIKERKNELNLQSYIPTLQQGAGSYFFNKDQWQYPKEDFDQCLEIDRFNFGIQAKLHEDYAILRRCD